MATRTWPTVLVAALFLLVAVHAGVTQTPAGCLSPSAETTQDCRVDVSGPSTDGCDAYFGAACVKPNDNVRGRLLVVFGDGDTTNKDCDNCWAIQNKASLLYVNCVDARDGGGYSCDGWVSRHEMGCRRLCSAYLLRTGNAS